MERRDRADRPDCLGPSRRNARGRRPARADTCRKQSGESRRRGAGAARPVRAVRRAGPARMVLCRRIGSSRPCAGRHHLRTWRGRSSRGRHFRRATDAGRPRRFRSAGNGAGSVAGRAAAGALRLARRDRDVRQRQRDRRVVQGGGGQSCAGTGRDSSLLTAKSLRASAIDFQRGFADQSGHRAMPSPPSGKSASGEPRIFRPPGQLSRWMSCRMILAIPESSERLWCSILTSAMHGDIGLIGLEDNGKMAQFLNYTTGFDERRRPSSRECLPDS